MTPIAAITGFQGLMMGLIFIVCLLLMMIILIQKGRGGGLASAFGGGGGGGGAFGAKTGDVFTGITVVLAGVYLLLTVAGNFAFRTNAAQITPAVQPAPGSEESSESEPVAPAAATETKAPSGALPDGSAPVEADDAGETGAAAGEPADDQPATDEPTDEPTEEPIDTDDSNGGM